MSRLVGARIPRREDARFLLGTSRFVDDIQLPGLLHAAVVRSPVAHGRLQGLDRSGLGTPVELVLGPDEIRARTSGDVPVVWNMPGQRQSGHPLVADRVRFVGEPVGVVVAASRATAEDAAEELSPELEELPVVASIEAALSAEALLYPEWGTNVAAEFEAGDSVEAVEEVLEASGRRLTARFTTGRLAGCPMECRGVVVDPTGGRLTVWTSTQSPHMVRDAIATVLGLSHARIRVIGPDVGGGFGVKDHIHEDELLICVAAVELERPVKWVEERRESVLATAQARGEVFDVEVAFDDDGRLRALACHGVRDAGAYLSVFGGGPLRTMADCLPGPYRWDAVRVTGKVVVTNRTPSGAYRGFGQPQATIVRERALDMVAAELGLDPVELRHDNMIRREELPYRTRTSLRFESGDYQDALRRASDLVRSDPEPPDDGRARGVGYASYVELCAIGPREGARILGVDVSTHEEATVQMDVDGTVRIYVGTSPHGQGHETTFAQLCADRLGVPVESITLFHSDTDMTPYSSYGTAASRSIAVAGGAVVRASERLARRVRRVAAELLEVDPDDVELAENSARVAGTRISIPIPEVAAAAVRGHRLPDEMEPGLAETDLHEPEDLSFSYATHACRVAVDRETGWVEIERFVVVHDCGTMVNPMIVEGQIHGGVTQGIGMALLEEVRYDENAQPVTSSLLDYLIPDATTAPVVEIEHTEHPSPFLPGGMKGMGEGGTIGAPAAVLNAVAAALPEIADKITRTPTSPEDVVTLLRATEAGRERATEPPRRPDPEARPGPALAGRSRPEG